MGDLYLMTTIVDKKMAKRYLDLYKDNNRQVMFLAFGVGTASSEILDYLGVEHNEKVIVFMVQQEEQWLDIKKKLRRDLKIDAPGSGIAFTVPLSSVGGKRTLNFLLENDDYQVGEESTLKDTTHELIMVIANQGNIDLVMTAARSAGAYGGTVVHAKGTGIEAAEKFMGVSLATEKEMIFIVAKKEQKNDIMQAIIKDAGAATRAKAIVFSLPVTDTAGLRLVEDTE